MSLQKKCVFPPINAPDTFFYRGKHDGWASAADQRTNAVSDALNMVMEIVTVREKLLSGELNYG